MDLTVLARNAQLLDVVELELRHNNKHASADALLKLQQDAGLECIHDEAAGSDSAKLYARYEPVTQDRMNRVLGGSYYIVTLGETAKSQLTRLLNTLHVPLQQTTPAMKVKPATPKS